MANITLSQFREKLQNARDNVDNEVSRIIDINKEDIYDFLRSQLSNGEDADGRVVGVYARNYARGAVFLESKGDGYFDKIIGSSNFGFPKSKGRPYNFQWTDSLFESFFHEYKNGILVVENKDHKVLFLKSKYGERLLDLSDFSGEGINNMINEELREWLIKNL